MAAPAEPATRRDPGGARHLPVRPHSRGTLRRPLRRSVAHRDRARGTLPATRQAWQPPEAQSLRLLILAPGPMRVPEGPGLAVAALDRAMRSALEVSAGL